MTRLEPPICVVLDVPTLEQARSVVDELGDVVSCFKVGFELFISSGPAAVDAVRSAGADVVLDLKIHDIPRTASRAVSQAHHIGATMLTVHGFGGRDMLRAAVETARELGGPKLLTVTVLTSHDEADLARIGLTSTAVEQAKRIARIAAEEGSDGLVLSPRELAVLRPAFPDLLLATPGIRPQGAAPDDQRRILTPAEAILAGADLLIVGRPILDASDRRAAALAIVEEVRRAESQLGARRPFDDESTLVDAEDAEIVIEARP